MKQPALKRFLDLAKQAGAAHAKLIDPGTVVTAAWVRLKCQFGCGGYGSSRMCPPASPTPADTRAALDEYGRAILLHFSGAIGAADPAAVAVGLERDLFLAGYYKALAFGAGPCGLCRKCRPTGCAHPDRARPSMEACGIDVYATARSNGLPIEVLTDTAAPGNFYALVLVD